LEIRFHKRQVSFLVVKTVKRTGDINMQKASAYGYAEYDCVSVARILIGGGPK